MRKLLENAAVVAALTAIVIGSHYLLAGLSALVCWLFGIQ